MSRALLWLLATLLSTSLLAADTDAERLARISGTDATTEDWQWAARSIADKALRSEVRTALLLRDPYPRKELASLLYNKEVAKLARRNATMVCAATGFRFTAPA